MKERRLLVTASRSARDAVGGPVAPRLLRRAGVLTLSDLARVLARGVCPSPEDLLRERLPGTDLGALRQEFGEVYEELVRRRDVPERGTYQREFDLEPAAAFVLYAITRTLQPAHVVETGVANGESSYIFLAAMQMNGSGILHSIDIRPDVGSRLTAQERDGWDLILLDRSRIRRDFRKRLRSLPQIDLFLHDSVHKYGHMRFEMEAVLPQMSPGGILACDDAESSLAFLDVCQQQGLPYSLLFDRTRLFGVAQLPTPVLDDEVRRVRRDPR